MYHNQLTNIPYFYQESVEDCIHWILERANVNAQVTAGRLGPSGLTEYVFFQTPHNRHTIVMFGGMMLSPLAHYLRLVPHLLHHCNVLLLDPGFESVRRQDEWTLALLEPFSLNSVSIVAHSTAVYDGISLANYCHETLKDLILINPFSALSRLTSRRFNPVLSYLLTKQGFGPTETGIKKLLKYMGCPNSIHSLSARLIANGQKLHKPHPFTFLRNNGLVQDNQVKKVACSVKVYLSSDAPVLFPIEMPSQYLKSKHAEIIATIPHKFCPSIESSGVFASHLVAQTVPKTKAKLHRQL